MEPIVDVWQFDREFGDDDAEMKMCQKMQFNLSLRDISAPQQQTKNRVKFA